MNNRDIENRLAEFLWELDVTFQQRPVYPILLDDEVPEWFVPCGEIQGWTSAFADLLARQLLERQRRWRSRGFAFFIVPPPANDWTDPSYLGQVCHEAGHYLTFSEEAVSFDYDNELECIRDALAPWATTDGFKKRAAAEDFWDSKNSEHVARSLHPPEWIRAAIHLAHRSQCRASRMTAAATEAYGYSLGLHFDLALAFEANQRRADPIREILKSNPPRKFTRLLERSPAPANGE